MNSKSSAEGYELDLPLSAMGLPSLGSTRLLGELLSDRIKLSQGHVREILDHAGTHGTRFGDAAVALGYATADQVLQALSTQFQYPCAAPLRQLDSDELVMLTRPHSAQAEALRCIRGQVVRRMSRATTHRRGTLAVVSPDPGDGKTFLVANLGIALAQTGARTLIVDADMRGPRMHEIFELAGRHGLSSALVGRADRQVVQAVAAVPGLYVLPCGITPPNPLELIERATFRTLMENLPQHFDHVLVDTPAVAYGADAIAIADCCRASLMVGRRNRSGTEALRHVAGQLDEDPEGFVGIIINDF